jgi:L-ascorbate metabolism protein UlaG (beta-lactamase superfamily)
MELLVTYLRHNCFLLELPNRGWRLVFDYPSAAHRDEKTEPLVREAVQGAEAFFFSSHGHPDHFTPEILDFKRVAARARYFVSEDIAALHPEFDPEQNPDALVVAPGDEYDGEEPILDLELGDMRVRGLESTDLGVGFLIQLPEARIWFGGDVAFWRWETLAPQALAFSERHYARTLKALRAAQVDLAFVNADKRLANWAGALDFVREVRPRQFVPMHCFGNAEWSAEFANLVKGRPDCAETTVWSYAAAGDLLRVSW